MEGKKLLKIKNMLQQFNIKQRLNTVKSVVQVATLNNALWTTDCFYVVTICSTLWAIFQFVFSVRELRTET